MPPTSGTTSLPLDAPLPRKTRAFIVLVALLQGGPLSLAALGQQHGMWPFTELGARICWYTLVMTIPGVALLRAQDLRDWPLFQHVAASTLVFTALGSWAAWTATGAPALNLIPVLWSFGFTVSLGWFVALPWLQHRQLRGHWRAGYRDLFEHAWQNALALLCVCVCWMVPGLWVSLFALVKIQAFRDLFREQTRIWSFCLSTTVGAAIRPCSRCAPPPAFTGSTTRKQQLEQRLARSSRWNRSEPTEDQTNRQMTDLPQIRQHVTVAAGQAAPPADWWQCLVRSQMLAGSCTQGNSNCVASSNDLDGDGQLDVTAVQSQQRIRPRLRAADTQPRWVVPDRHGGSLSLDSEAKSEVSQALRNGQIQTRHNHWPELALPGDRRIHIRPSEEGLRPETRP